MEKKFNKQIEIIVWMVFIVMFNIVSYFLETNGLSMPKWVSLGLRISTVVIDVIFVLYIRKLRIYYRKKFKKNFPKKTITIFWLADTATILLVFYSLYILKVTLLFVVSAISLESFLYALSGGLLIGIVFGRPIAWFIRKNTKIIAFAIKKKVFGRKSKT